MVVLARAYRHGNVECSNAMGPKDEEKKQKELTGGELYPTSRNE
jgi:hypothetical protein